MGRLEPDSRVLSVDAIIRSESYPMTETLHAKPREHIGPEAQ